MRSPDPLLPMLVYNTGDVARALSPGYRSAFEEMNSAMLQIEASLQPDISPFYSIWDDRVKVLTLCPTS